LRFRNLLFQIGLLALGPAALTPASAQTPPPLFDVAVEPVASPPARADRDRSGPQVFRARTARLVPARLDGALAAGLAGDRQPLVELNLFPDAVYRGVFERSESDRMGHRTWVGRVEGDPTSTITLTWRGETVLGAVRTSDLLFRIAGTMDAAVIEQVDPSTFGDELEPLAAPDAPADHALNDPPPAAADGEVVDVLVYYTTAARTAQGGVGAMQALIATAVADANTAYSRSGLSASLRLAGAAELTGYVEAADMSSDLTALRNNAGVAAARNAAGADLVALIVAASSGGACGIGYLGPTSTAAHSVTSRTCIVGNYTFAHELGHNFGSHHAPEDGATGAWKPYGYGYKDAVANTRTVMAYAPGTRLLNFSNPAVLHNGRATGTATQNNALSLREAFPIVQAFRAAPAGPPSAPGAPQQVAAAVSGNVLTVSWAAASGAPTGYALAVGSTPGAANVFSGPVGPVMSVSAPVPAGTYYIRVHAQNAAGTGPASSEVVASVGAGAGQVPGAPQGLSASVAGSLVSLTWAPPATGGAVASYVVQAGTAPGAANLFNGAVGAATATSGALGAGTYYVRVLGQNAAGLGPASSEVAVTVGGCTAPAAPMLSGSRSGNVISIGWTMPAGGPVTGFVVQAGPTSGSSALFNGAVGAVTAVSAPVGPGTYFIRVLATSACGTGASSNEVAITVP
jgi:hypothetical protein